MLSPDRDLIAQYESGYQGVVPNPAADKALVAMLQQRGGYAAAGQAIQDYDLKDTGKGKLSLPYIAALQLYPGCLPGGSQGRGSCVAWNTRNAALVSYCAYIMYGQNAERFTAPAVSPAGIQNGVASTEGIYWYRHHASDGWDGASAAKVAIEKCGLMLRQNYPTIGIDLTTYSAETEGRWGATEPPENVQQITRQHLCSNATVCETYEEVRDMLANGYAISTCGGESFSFNRDDWGVSSRTRQGWSHAMAMVGVDDRPETIAKYGCGLVVVQNSWGDAFHGNDIIHGTALRIPVGSFWARWADVRDRYCVALGPSKGWPAAKLPDWGLGGII
jgi:hypothetical protein